MPPRRYRGVKHWVLADDRWHIVRGSSCVTDPRNPDSVDQALYDSYCGLEGIYAADTASGYFTPPEVKERLCPECSARYEIRWPGDDDPTEPLITLDHLMTKYDREVIDGS